VAASSRDALAGPWFPALLTRPPSPNSPRQLRSRCRTSTCPARLHDGGEGGRGRARVVCLWRRSSITNNEITPEFLPGFSGLGPTVGRVVGSRTPWPPAVARL